MNSGLVNKHIRKILKPFLIENGFDKTTDRNYIKTTGIFDYSIKIESIGNYSSDVSGWPPQSVFLVSGVFCNIIKKWHKHEYHYQLSNLFSLDQEQYTNKISDRPGHNRNDWLWIDDDTDLDEIVKEIKNSIQNYSFAFFDKFKDKKVEDLIEEKENSNDKYFESFRLYYLYKYLKIDEKAEEKKKIFFEEGRKLGLKEKELINVFEE